MEMAMENITRAQQEVEMSSQFNIRFTVMMNVAQPVGTLAIFTMILLLRSAAGSHQRLQGRGGVGALVRRQPGQHARVSGVENWVKMVK